MDTNGSDGKAAKRTKRLKKQKRMSMDTVDSVPDKITSPAKSAVKQIPSFLVSSQTKVSQPANLFPTGDFAKVHHATNGVNPNLNSESESHDTKAKISKKQKKSTHSVDSKADQATVELDYSSSDRSLRSKQPKTEVIKQQSNQLVESTNENEKNHKKTKEQQLNHTEEIPKDNTASQKKSKKRSTDVKPKVVDVEQIQIIENEKSQKSKIATPTKSETTTSLKSKITTPT
ncbi:hypothetical protein HK096_000096, partial [Nowakowskiella sp. JEL0078]